MNMSEIFADLPILPQYGCEGSFGANLQVEVLQKEGKTRAEVELPVSEAFAELG